MLLSSLIFIHGLNNNPAVLKPISEALCSEKIECHHIILPGHKKHDRNITKNSFEAQKAFDLEVAKLTHKPYKVIAFSQGALYFENYLLNFPNAKRPEQSVYFAPAFFIKKQALIKFATWALPDNLMIPSYAPDVIRNFPSLHVYEYKNLIQMIESWQKSDQKFMQPTLILADKNDELVDVEKLKQMKDIQFEWVERKNVKKRTHHLVVHPDFYEQKEWALIIDKLRKFLISR